MTASVEESPDPAVLDSAELALCTGPELRDVLVRRSSEMHRAFADVLAVIGECSARGERFGYHLLWQALRDVLRLSDRDAKRQIEQAEALRGSRTLTGETIPPALPCTATALAEGAIGAEHVAQIQRTVQAMPTWVEETERAAADERLAAAARTLDPARVGRLGRRILTYLDQDGTPPDERELAQPHNELRLSTKRSGRVVFTGELDALSGAQFTALLSPLAKPRPTQDGQQDPRTTTERHGDAFVELIELLGRSDTLPTEAGERPHLLVQVSAEALRSGIGTATLDGGTPVPAARLRSMACDAKLIPVVLNSYGVPLDVGRAQRTAPPHLRHALIARDGGCTFPGCDRPPRWAQAHHIRHWESDGETALHNMTLLCGAHHRLIHHTPWDVRIGADGHPEYLPPDAIDPTRTARRNTMHTPPG